MVLLQAVVEVVEARLPSLEEAEEEVVVVEVLQSQVQQWAEEVEEQVVLLSQAQLPPQVEEEWRHVVWVWVWWSVWE